MRGVIIPAFVALFWLSGCEDKSYTPPTPDTETTQGGVFSDQIKALDKAKGVESTLQQHDQSTREAIDQAEQDPR